MSDYALMCGLPRTTSHLPRKQFAQHLLGKRSLLLQEAEEYTMCHSNETARHSYLGPGKKKALSILGSSWYLSSVGVPEQRIAGQENVFASSEQAQRLRKGQLEVLESQAEEYMELSEKRDQELKTREGQAITNIEKFALLEALGESIHYPISRRGSLLDIFMTSDPIIRKQNYSIMLRMVMLMPSELLCVQELRDSLVSYAQTVADKGYPARQVCWIWSIKLVNCLDILKRSAHLPNSRIIKLLVDLNQDNDMKYTMGSDAIKNQVTLYIARANERKARVSGDIRLGMTDYIREEQAKLKAAASKPSSKAPQPTSTEVEVEQDVASEEEADLTRAEAQNLRVGNIVMEVIIITSQITSLFSLLLL